MAKRQGRVQPPQTPEPSVAPAGRAPEPERIGETVRVLIIDDEPNVIQSLGDILKTHGMESLGALYGEEGIRLATEESPDVILLDSRMPGISGFDVCTILKQEEHTRHIPIIFLTGRDITEENVVRGLELGAYDYITKPYRVAELLSRIRVMARIKFAEQRARELSVTDELTGLYNRRFLLQRLEEELSRARRYRLPLTCVLIDLDNFKRVNDDHGHQAGDHVLRQVGQLLRHECRKEDILARYGGEEFTVVLSGDEQDGRGASERLRHRLETSPLTMDGATVTITASFGVACYPTHMPEGDLSALLHLADVALYQAKRAGRNRVVTYSRDFEPDKGPAPQAQGS
jgi:diguanylate cyclase (GGDEF)-like protein